MAVKPIPDGYHAVTPYLVVRGAGKAIEFYKKVFGATERMRFEQPGGKVGHAELQFRDSVVMLADEVPEMGFLSPQSVGGTSITLVLFVEDVDACVKGAVAAGATILRPVADQFYGDRSGVISDPFGHLWNVATHKEDVSPEEMQRRMKEAMSKQGQ